MPVAAVDHLAAVIVDLTLVLALRAQTQHAQITPYTAIAVLSFHIKLSS
jgi:hypothetical protein